MISTTATVLTFAELAVLILKYGLKKVEKQLQRKNYAPIIEKGLQDQISGVAVSVIVGKLKKVNEPNSHAHMMFKFSTGEWVKCEIKEHQDGAAEFITKVEEIQFNDYFEGRINEEKKVTLIEIYKASFKYATEKGDFHLIKHNSYDYSQYMLNKFSETIDEQQTIDKWKKLELVNLGIVEKQLI